VEKRKAKKSKQISSEASVNSPWNLWSQSWRRKEKEGYGGKKDVTTTTIVFTAIMR